MADLADDPEYVEACRVAAWSGRPRLELLRYWDMGAKAFAFPEGWPEGVNADEFVRRQIVICTPSPTDTTHSCSVQASPSVRRLREMLR